MITVFVVLKRLSSVSSKGRKKKLSKKRMPSKAVAGPGSDILYNGGPVGRTLLASLLPSSHSCIFTE